MNLGKKISRIITMVMFLAASSTAFAGFWFSAGHGRRHWHKYRHRGPYVVLGTTFRSGSYGRIRDNIHHLFDRVKSIEYENDDQDKAIDELVKRVRELERAK